MLRLSDSARMALDVTGDVVSFGAAILVVGSMLAVNADQLKAYKRVKDEADAIVMSMDLGRKLTIAGLVFLCVGLTIKVVLLRVF